jgi:precorrin-6x reductase
MADYTVVNATGAVLVDVNAGDDDVAEGVVSGVALDATELEALLEVDGVAVLIDASEELLAVFQALAAELELEDPSGEQTVVVVDVSAGTTAAAAATSGSDILLAVAGGDLVVKASLTDEQKRYAARVLTHGSAPDKVTS